MTVQSISLSLILSLGLATPLLAKPTKATGAAVKPSATRTESLAQPRIRAIEIIGLKRIEAKSITGIMLLKVGESLDRKLLAGDIKRIFTLGYFDDVQVDFIKESGKLVVRLEEKPTIVDIIFLGNTEKKADELIKEIGSKTLTYLNRKQLKADVAKLVEFYSSKGFFVADIHYEIETIRPGEVRVKFVIKEGRRVYIRRINIIGNHALSDKELKKVLRTKEKNWLSFLNDSGTYQEGLFDQDRAIMTQFYGHKGYIKVKVGEPDLSLSADKRSLFLSFSIEEGDLYKVGAIDFSGDLIKDKSELTKLLTVKTGDIADSIKIRGDVEKLSELYADDGYFFVNVVPRTRDHAQEKLVDINFAIEKGEKTFVDKIEIHGNTSTRDKVIRREMLLHEGDLFSGSKLRLSKFNLDRLGFFSEVKITTPRSSADNKINIIIEVTEQSTGAFSIGAGFNSVESFQFISQIQKRNLFGLGYDIALQAQLGGKTQSFNLRYVDPYFLDSHIGFNFSAFMTERQFIDFTQASTGGSTGLTFPLYTEGKKRMNLGLNYNLVDEEIKDIRQSIERLFDDGITSSITLSLVYETRNRSFEPTSGEYLKLSAEMADGEITGDNSFGKFVFEASKHFPIIPPTAWFLPGSVLQFHLNVGYLTGFGGPIPLFERFFPGGILSIRGYELRSLGPQIQIASDAGPTDFITEKFPIGGNKEFIFNTEYLFPVFTPAGIKGVLFFDWGNAFAEGEPFDLIDFRRAVGFGIRWFSPIGPLRFEWGFPLDRQEDESFVVFDFTIGSLF